MSFALKAKQTQISRATSLLGRVVAAVILVSSLVSCFRIVIRDVYEPVYLAYEDLRAGIAATDPSEIGETGKIYVKDGYLYVNELYAGVHVFDNRDPASPERVSFIPIPGNVDIAIRGTTLYADSYVDLVAVDVSAPTRAIEVGRIEGAFPYDPWSDLPPDRLWSTDDYETPDEEIGVVIGWEKTRRRIAFERTDSYDVLYAGASESSGTGGSLARFTIVDDYLYALHDTYLQLVSLTEPQNPVLGGRVEVGWDIETIFPYGDLLFIGSTTGMYVYDNTVRSQPVQLSRFAHVTSCDPVVVAGDRAYVTLRSGNRCGGDVDRLDIIDVSDLENPAWISSFAMTNPHGVGIDGFTLFVCDGSAGLRVFDVSSSVALHPLAEFPDREVFDVILVSPLAIVVGPDGIDQYDYTDREHIRLLGHLDVVQGT